MSNYNCGWCGKPGITGEGQCFEGGVRGESLKCLRWLLEVAQRSCAGGRSAGLTGRVLDSGLSSMGSGPSHVVSCSGTGHLRWPNTVFKSLCLNLHNF